MFFFHISSEMSKTRPELEAETVTARRYIRFWCYDNVRRDGFEMLSYYSAGEAE
jgi:hypothetical protein